MAAPDIEFEDSLYGVRHWAYWDMIAVPRFEVYRYMGRRSESYVFQSVRHGFLFSCTPDDLEKIMTNRIFRPFVLPKPRLTVIK